MKKKVAMLLACVMVLSFCACGGEESSNEKEGQGSLTEMTVSGEDTGNTSAVANDEAQSSNTEGDDLGQGDGAEAENPVQEGLGFREEVDYQGINEGGTDTDKLAFLDGDTVHIFDFGEGCDIAAEIAMNHRGLVSSIEEDVQLHFSAGGSPREEFTSFGLYREGLYIIYNGIKRQGELWAADDEVIVVSEDNSFAYVNSSMMEEYYDVSMTPNGGSFPVVVNFAGVDNLDTLYATVEWMKTNYQCYKLVTYEDINSAVDIDGNWVDLSSYIFYEDILARELKDYFGIVVKDFTVFEDGDGSYYDFKSDTLIETNFSASLSSQDFTEEDAIDFLGYQAYVVPGKEIYLQYNFNDWSVSKGDIIRFKINPKETLATEEETLVYLEDRLFSDKLVEAE